jgi:hypothetical protein
MEALRMRINIENAVRHMDVSKEGRFLLEELVKHLKMVRDEFAEGNWGIIGEFFELYRFGDNQTDEENVLNQKITEISNKIRDLTDENLRQAVVIEELSKTVVFSMIRSGITQTHEDCPKCNTRGFTEGVACDECGGLGRRRLENPVRMEPLNHRVDGAGKILWRANTFADTKGTFAEDADLVDRLKKVALEQSGEELEESVRFLLDLPPKGKEWLPDPLTIANSSSQGEDDEQ